MYVNSCIRKPNTLQYTVVEEGKHYREFLKKWIGPNLNIRDGFFVVTTPAGNVVARVGDIIVKHLTRYKVYTKEMFNKKYSKTLKICSVTGGICLNEKDCSDMCKIYLT